MLIVSMSTLFQASPIHASTSYVVHSPILISGNSGFTAQNGVTGGTGTRSDPFLISGWSIVAPYGQAAIYIQSTTAYFSINHVQLLNAQQGIYLTSVTNGSIKNSTLMNSNFGIHIESSTNVTITGNNISGFYGNGVYNADILSAPQTTGLNIANNTFSGAGIVVYSSQSLPLNLNMTKNTFIATGVSTNGYGAIVVRNNLTGTSPMGSVCLCVTGNNSLVSDNWFNAGDIQVSGSGTIVRNNRADRILLGGTTITLSDNELTSGIQISPSGSDSHIMTGNTVNGKPLRYLARSSGTNIDGAVAGEVIVANCSNVRVANLRISGAQYEMIMIYVHQGIIVGNNLSGNNSTGLDITHSSGLQISGNNFTGVKVSISSTDNVTFTGNLGVGGVSPAAVRISGGRNFSVSANTLRGTRGTTGLNLADLINATLAGNWISDYQYGVAVSGANGLNITANNFVRNQEGLRLDRGNLQGIFNSGIYHNNFVDNSQYQAAHDHLMIAFDNGYPSGGNYWSDYTGVDNCRGPQQNVCSGPDGIGDKPYTGIWDLGGGYTSTLLDHYPLVNPYGNFRWDTTAPIWPAAALLTVSILNSTRLTLQWTIPVDDSWITGYRLYQDGMLMTSLPRNVTNYVVAGLSPGSTHAFKVEAGDPARNWSTDGPSTTATLPQAGNPPLFSPSWWMEHWYLGVAIGGSVAFAVEGIFLFRRKKSQFSAQRKT
jgi:parallel beta-helix repeat protein